MGRAALSHLEQFQSIDICGRHYQQLIAFLLELTRVAFFQPCVHAATVGSSSTLQPAPAHEATALIFAHGGDILPPSPLL